MALDWQSKLAELDAARSSAHPTDQAIAVPLRAELVSAGNAYDEKWPTSPPDLLTESTEHAQWSASMLVAASDLDQIAALADGKPPAVLGDDGSTAVSAALKRIREALALPNLASAYRSLMLKALNVQRPQEPQFYIPSYYASTERVVSSTTVNGTTRTRDVRFAGDIQRYLKEVMDEVEAWLEVVP